MPIIIGVDVGGTNTDAVATDLALSHASPADSIIAHCKIPTTPDTSKGIGEALREVLEQLPSTARSDITAVNIGTTHFINAVVEKDASKLTKVAILRLCGPYAREVPPFAGLPDDLRPLVEGFSAWLPGGLENSVFHQEEHVRDILRSVLGTTVHITLSHEVAGIGFIERENATILNATILPFAKKTIKQFQQSLRGLRLSASLFLTRNDGTLISADDAANLPVSTFISGPTNSLTGAAFLAGAKNGLENGALILDIGGTTSDVCALEPSGLPRPAAAISHLAGVRTNFAVPDVRSIGVGGGSLVQIGNSGAVTVGPQSVGKHLVTKARVFGGSVLTATDIIVAAGLQGLGDRSQISTVSKSVVNLAKAQIQLLLERVIDEMKTSEADVPIILVGGGSILCPDNLKGVSHIIRPAFSHVANAVGAAMAKVSGVVNTIVNLTDDKSEDEAIARARAQAISQAEENGAENAEVVEEIILPVPYVNTRSRHIVVRAADLDFIADGCAILGCGGGGDTYASYLSVKKLLAAGEVVNIISPDTLPDNGFIPAVAVMGSPSTFSERLPSGEELKNSVDAVLRSQNKSVSDLTAVMSLEIGGSNGMRGIQAALWTKKPLVDADLMGRAYPNLWQVTPNNAGISLAPAAASDAKGNTLVQVQASSNKDVEDMLRAICVQMGQAAGISLGALTGQQVKSTAAQRSFSLAWRLGRAVKIARLEKRDIVDGILSTYPGRRILTGKITRVTRDVRGAFTEGSIEIVPFSESNASAQQTNESRKANSSFKITFQNENIHAFDTDSQKTLASVPDLICVLDAEDGRALGTQDYRYGLRVHVFALVGSPQWTQGEGLKNGGPEAFGYVTLFQNAHFLSYAKSNMSVI
ncbi:putative hydantoinase oxoprolinase protein [Phaeoacremonium minimum UCRPA7]|uniref:Putative hydantoinase oxoprolinase protein n=1 Tax=Phaeoacremonium minimum (strain UCR-PA7) TaxID=1286976 RepID=R8BQ89_PHAM7|nr:putative hydantoinase oxoprolinase protein [Phaeoacremonium minimum UCRPA7]EOO01543.1 putative hydantoinase oxoprolinase protein [Phaeoacremonium minimum UCRPA7]